MNKKNTTPQMKNSTILHSAKKLRNAIIKFSSNPNRVKLSMKTNLLTLVLLAAMVSACDGRTAKEVGQDAAKEKLDQVEGAAQVVKENGEGVAQVVGEGVGNVVKGIGKGLDTSLTTKSIKIADDATDRAIDVTRAQPLTLSESDEKGLSVYLISQSGFDGNLRLTAYTNNSEVGRSQAEIKLSPGEAKYVDFTFDNRTPLEIVSHFTIAASPTTQE